MSKKIAISRVILGTVTLLIVGFAFYFFTRDTGIMNITVPSETTEPQQQGSPPSAEPEPYEPAVPGNEPPEEPEKTEPPPEDDTEDAEPETTPDAPEEQEEPPEDGAEDITEPEDTVPEEEDAEHLPDENGNTAPEDIPESNTAPDTQTPPADNLSDPAVTLGLMLETISDTTYDNSVYKDMLPEAEYDAFRSQYAPVLDDNITSLIHMTGITGDAAETLNAVIRDELRETRIHSVTSEADGDTAAVSVVSEAVDLAAVRSGIETKLFTLPLEEAMNVMSVLLEGGNFLAMDAVFPILIEEIKNAERIQTGTRLTMRYGENTGWALSDEADIIGVYVINTDALIQGF